MYDLPTCLGENNMRNEKGSLIGAHFSRNGVEYNWPTRVILTCNGEGANEQLDGTIVVFRDITVPERPDDLYTKQNPDGSWAGKDLSFAKYYYDQYKDTYIEATYADYYTFTNEAVGSDSIHELDIFVEYERNFCKLATQDNLKLSIGSLAGNSPNFDLWKEYYAPWIKEAWEQYGAAYGRHVYGNGDLANADGTMNTDQPAYPQRIIDEIEYLKSIGWNGAVYFKETGLDWGYGVANQERFYNNITGLEKALRPYADNVIGFCWWEAGNTGWGADYTSLLKEITPYMNENLIDMWTEPTDITPTPEPKPVDAILSFEAGWIDDPLQPDRRQVPNGFKLNVLEPDSDLWYPGGEGKVTGTVEALHRVCGENIPANQCVDGNDPLILDGETTYKIQAVNMASCTELVYNYYISSDNVDVDIKVPVNVHYQSPHTYDREPPLDDDDIYVVLLVNDVEHIKLTFPEVVDREWMTLHTTSNPKNGVVKISLRFQTSWKTTRDLFTDKWVIEATPKEVPTEKHKVVILKIPQEFEQDGWLEAANWAYPNYKRTQTASHDDMMTMLRAGNAQSYAVIIDPWLDSQQQAIEMLSNEGYSWERLELGYPPIETIDVEALGQCDPKWGSDWLGTGNVKTICSYGCLLTAYTMLARYWGINDNRYPDGENDYYITNNGFNAQYLVGLAMSKVYPNVKNDGWLWRGEEMHSKTQEYLSKNIPVCARVDFKPETDAWDQHWVLLVGYDDVRDDYLMNDPWTGKKGVYVSDYYGIDGSDVLECIYYTLDDTPPTNKYDLLPYIEGDGTLYEVKNSSGGQERFQTQIPSGSIGEFWQTKNQHAEQLFADTSYIYRGWDTSPGNNRFYQQQEPKGATDSKWLPRYMAIGEEFVVSLWVQFYNWDCSKSDANTGQVTDSRKLVAHYDVWESPYGITLNDVVEIHWLNGGEKYFYAKGFGLVGWSRIHDDPNTPISSAISEIHAPGSRENNVVSLPNCL